MTYNLWLADRRAIHNYYCRRLDARGLSSQMAIGDVQGDFPLPLTIDGVVKEELWLDEIDSFTCCFRNLDEVRSELRKHPEYSMFADNPGFLTIASKSDNIGKFRVIYDNEFLKECADAIRRKRRNGEPLYLDDIPEVEKFAQKIANYTVDENASMSLIGFTILPPPVLTCLKNYRISVLENTGARDKFFEKFSHYCMNYKILRAFIIWEQDYLEMEQSKEIEQRTITRNTRSEREQIYQTMKFEEELRRMPYNDPVALDIDGMRGEDGNIDFDKVYGIYDLEDVHRLGDTTLQQLGIIPVKLPGKGLKKK